MRFSNSYAQLPSKFYQKTKLSSFHAPELIAWNDDLARELGIEFTEDQKLSFFSGSQTIPGSEPMALAYAGHQFGHFVSQLGDGRAALLCEVLDRHGNRRDIQLKGSGPTFFSRRGDGKSALGPVVREYLVSEAMNALGISTTRSLAAVATGEKVRREELRPGGVLTRVASSHIRIGTFEYFAAQKDVSSVKILADYAIARHFPEISNTKNVYQEFFRSVCQRQSLLIAQWMSVGFIHGVMNTDNMAISGETLDFGPCAFLDAYQSDKVFSSIDREGRYAFANQPKIAQWNLMCLANCLIPILDQEEKKAITFAEETLHSFSEDFDRNWLELFSQKLGFEQVQSGDRSLVNELLRLMEIHHVDFTNGFREIGQDNFVKNFGNGADFPEVVNWLEKWNHRLTDSNQDKSSALRIIAQKNPWIIARNHRVEECIDHAYLGDYSYFQRLHLALKTPLSINDENADLIMAPKPSEVVHETFCGT